MSKAEQQIQQIQQRVMSALRQKLEELRQRAIDNGMKLQSENELRMEKNVLEALAALNKPPGLPESAYWSDAMALWIYQIAKLAVKDGAREVLAERLYWYPQPNWWQPIGEGATHPLRYRESTHTGEQE